MNLQQLETFRWIARYGSFSQAARKVNATQSTVSMRLGELEKELGIQLLDRTRRAVRVTPKGRDLLRYAEEMSLLVSEIRQYVGNSRAISGTLRIGAAELVALTWLPALIKAIKSRYPQVDVELEVGLGGSMVSLLASGALDLVLMPTGGQPVPGLRTIALGDVRFGFVASPALGVPTRPVAPVALLDWPIITHGPSSVLHRILEEWFAQGGAHLDRFVVSNSMEAAARLAEAGLGVTFLPLFHYEPAIADGRLMRVRSSPAIPAVAFSAVFPRGRPLPLVEAIVALAAEHCSFAKRRQRA